MDFLKVQDHIKRGELKEAKEMLAQSSYQDKNTSQYKKTTRLYEQKAQKLRKVFVDKNIKKVKEYIKSHQYENAYHLLNDLENIDSSNQSILKLKSKVVTKLNKKLKSSAKKLLDTSTAEINQFIKNNQDQKALEITYNLQALPDTLRKQLEINTKRKIIDNKLKRNKQSLKKTPTPQRYDFIKNLYDLEPNYPKIQKLLLQARDDLSNYSKIQKKNILNNLLQETKILFNKKQFQKTKETSKRILSIDPSNLKATRYYKKADHCYYNDSYKKAYNILQSKTSK